MAEFFLELFSEEIPARMQARAAEDLSRLLTEALAPLIPVQTQTFYGPRRLAFTGNVSDGTPEAKISERGPRANASEQALAGFLRKHNAAREDMRQDGDYWLLEKTSPALTAATLIAEKMPNLLRRFPWPKSMRWGGTSNFTWVRPLRRITCLLDGTVVPFTLRDGTDDGHGLVSANITEGHRFHTPTPITISSVAQWHQALREARVIIDAQDRKFLIGTGIAKLAGEKGLNVVDDAGLLDEVAGLVEWPVPLLGRIDDTYMDLPTEVLQVSMRVNQRYFALRNPDGSAAPYFAFVANVEATDGGATIIAGNERVLRARFADARHFWDFDRKTRLESLTPKLDHVTFHAKLGSQGERVRRIENLAAHIAPHVGAAPEMARAAARLCKADLLSGMVGEFPELQGVMGRYYALHDGENSSIAAAIRDHYAPKGPGDAVPTEPVAIAIALADKIFQLAGFFAINEKPTGAGDPYALRRAALGVIRVIRENQIRLPLSDILDSAMNEVRHAIAMSRPQGGSSGVGASTIRRRMASGSEAEHDNFAFEILDFLAERLRVQLRTEGARHDVLSAVFAAGADDDIVRLLARTDAVAALLGTDTGKSLLAAYKRAANILRIEDRKDGPHQGVPDEALFQKPEEKSLALALAVATPTIAADLRAENFAAAIQTMAGLRGALDAFFEKVTVNDPLPEFRRNRLRLLRAIVNTLDAVASFSRIEG
ncbi:MAG: glycine--tRNA ligase subunit beta [Acetobacteraceae bacterium]|nr:glycine--tRNA ligase subunit beta [Acetobacteraceae bacterium]